MFGIGPKEWGIIIVLGLLLFGSKKIPELARSLGKSMNAFKKGLKEGVDETEEPSEDSPESPSEEGKD